MVGKDTSKPTVIREMQEIQDTMEEYEYRVEIIEKSLKSTELSDEAREKLMVELQDILKSLSTLETGLQGLRRENSKTFAFAALLMFFSFLGYGIYVMLNNPN